MFNDSIIKRNEKCMLKYSRLVRDLLRDFKRHNAQK